MKKLSTILEQQVKTGSLLASSAQNIDFFYNREDSEAWERRSIEELISAEQWAELNDRFFKTLTFGTGGLRGRTVGKIVTSAEQGTADALGRPQFPAVGTNAMNFFNVSRATQGLIHYLVEKFPQETPRITIAFDTRFFSREFARLVAKIAAEMGADAFLFAEERPVPELSFAVRYLGAHAGVMITASHNPWHDNGYKVYFQDGAQIVEPHASGIIAKVLEISSSSVNNLSPHRGTVAEVCEDVDYAYLDATSRIVVDPELLKTVGPKLVIVYSPVHGTGIKTIPRLLGRFGIPLSIVEEQAVCDGRFPTVESPNPANPPSLQLAVDQARSLGADLALGTDPDCDRVGVAVRSQNGDYIFLDGNELGSILAEHRASQFLEKGLISPDQAGKCAMIKTFVTTDLQREIAEHYGFKCIETLTGFKYMGEKLHDYEQLAGGRGHLKDEAWRQMLLEKSTYCIYGAEESYGYLAGDHVRDKDANEGILMTVEAAAWAWAQGKTLLDLLTELFLRYGCYAEFLGTKAFEGAVGAQNLKRLLDSYRAAPPADWNGAPIIKIQNFAEDEIYDADGKRIPPELMFVFHFLNGDRIALRASGTEPIVKYYFFARLPAERPEQLPAVKERLKRLNAERWEFAQRDIERRVNS